MDESIIEIPLKKIDTLDNIRQQKQDGLGELMNSIKQYGLMQPIGVKKEKKTYVLIWGFRRFLAFKKLGYKKIPSRIFYKENEVLTEEEFLIVNASENIHRKEITVAELGRVLTILKKKGLNINEISARLSLPSSRVSNALSTYSRLPEELTEKIAYIDKKKNTTGKIPVTLANRILGMRLNTQQTKEMFNFVKDNDINSYSIDLIGHLLKAGMTVKQAKNQWINWKYTTVTLVVSKNFWEETRGNLKPTIRSALKKCHGNDVLLPE